jgi:hypothetical protein
MHTGELRALIRERIRTGQLPPVLGGKTFVGRGNNTACDCCGQIMSRHELVYEVQLTLAWTVFGRGYIAHTRCHWIWLEESASQSAPPPSRWSHSLVWDALRDSLKRTDRLVN